MRCAKVVAVALLATLLAWSEASAAELDGIRNDGWHTWQPDSADPVRFYVLMEDGKPVDIRAASFNCAQPTGAKIIDHGRISAQVSFAWFRAVAEDVELDREIRDDALFGVVQSGSDAAYAYIDRILSQN